MRVVSVNLGERRTLDINDKAQHTGIFKQPAVDPVRVNAFGLIGDYIGNTKYHGGMDQAVYLYSAEEYDWWSTQLGESVQPGTFGENVTLDSFGREPLRIGDRFEIGEVLLEVTAPRIPCATFATRMQDTAFVKKFRQARRPGAYARVLREGELQAGLPVTRLPETGEAPTVVEVFELWYEKDPGADAMRRLLGARIAERTRAAYEKKLRELGE